DALDQLADLAADMAPDLSTKDIDFLPCVVNPNKILCIGINYRKHVLEMGRELPEYPWVFTRFADSFVGHGANMLRPAALSRNFDFEGELAVIIGSAAHRVAAADALDHVAGYTCLNDGSIRDYQRHSSQFTAGKNFLKSGSIGPWLVTPDELGDASKLDLETRLNGEVMQSSPTSDLIFDIPALIEYCSAFTRLEPGDIIATGTPGGVGAARTPPVWMQPGDTIEVSISGIGVLRNTIADE
ncbi:MAG: fumarylacetoacetate hydrolase family protein, partial [Gammaproteobacteria bacterium]|nr:fumarylacetoacetate hydrolase family protein [Gammaproteobacteria bacterium]